MGPFPNDRNCSASPDAALDQLLVAMRGFSAKVLLPKVKAEGRGGDLESEELGKSATTLERDPLG